MLENFIECRFVEETNTASGFYVEPATGTCPYCGRTIQVPYPTNQCPCGVWYNKSGEELLPPGWEKEDY